MILIRIAALSGPSPKQIVFPKLCAINLIADLKLCAINLIADLKLCAINFIAKCYSFKL